MTKYSIAKYVSKGLPYFSHHVVWLPAVSRSVSMSNAAPVVERVEAHDLVAALYLGPLLRLQGPVADDGDAARVRLHHEAAQSLGGATNQRQTPNCAQVPQRSAPVRRQTFLF